MKRRETHFFKECFLKEDFFFNRWTPLWARNDALLSNTQKRYRQFSTKHLLILPEPNAPSSLPPSEAIHNISRNAYATESSLIIHQLSWQTSPPRATNEAVLGKWQGRRPLPAWSLDQDSAYPAIYPLWTGGVGWEEKRWGRWQEKWSRQSSASKNKRRAKENAASHIWKPK